MLTCVRWYAAYPLSLRHIEEMVQERKVRRKKFLNNVVERDHRAAKRIVRPMLGFKSFHRAHVLIAGIETMHMIKKEQLDCPAAQASSAASQFHSLAF